MTSTTTGQSAATPNVIMAQSSSVFPGSLANRKRKSPDSMPGDFYPGLEQDVYQTNGTVPNYIPENHYAEPKYTYPVYDYTPQAAGLDYRDGYNYNLNIDGYKTKISPDSAAALHAEKAGNYSSWNHPISHGYSTLEPPAKMPKLESSTSYSPSSTDSYYPAVTSGSTSPDSSSTMFSSMLNTAHQTIYYT